MIDNTLRTRQVLALKEYYEDSFKSFEEYAAGGYEGKYRKSRPFPEICLGMKCEAKTRSGLPCKNDGTNWRNGRCKFHGGASTGPITEEGKKKVSKNAKKQTPCRVSNSQIN